MGRKITALMLSFVCFLSVFSNSSAVQARVIHETDLENYIMEEMSAANILGMGISIVSADKELYCAAYGTAHKTSSDYVLGDLSKSFTAAGIMRMAEDGDLSLEDKVSDYLPEYKSLADITVQELLYQTSGIAFEQQMSELEATEGRGTFEDAFANYNLLGEIIEKVSGMTYEEYISDNILDPLDMTSTYSLRTGSDESSELLTGYQSYFGFPSALRYQYDKEDDWIQVPSGYLISDIKDMGKYLQMYLKEGGDVLSKDSVHRMLYDGVVIPSSSRLPGELFDGSARYSMGWIEKEVKGQTILYHAGKTENFTSLMVLLPDLDLGITLLFNSMDYMVGQKLIRTLEEGIISIEMGETPVKIDSKSYLLGHGAADAVMLFALIASWMPILLMGGWIRRRKKKLIYVPGLIVDILVQIVLPTVLLFVLFGLVPSFIVIRFVPDVYITVIAVSGSLYLGGAIKLIAGIILKAVPIKGDKKIISGDTTGGVEETPEEKLEETQEGEKPEESKGQAAEAEEAVKEEPLQEEKSETPLKEAEEAAKEEKPQEEEDKIVEENVIKESPQEKEDKAVEEAVKEEKPQEEENTSAVKEKPEDGGSSGVSEEQGNHSAKKQEIKSPAAKNTQKPVPNKKKGNASNSSSQKHKKKRKKR
ncbi:MAG: serine hydrolase [Lachnospiraceae bacterium]|nr:serine hydrolase [Lachnospiraceae bacterium]